MITPRGIFIPDEEISFAYKRASGPGGQHVNKTSTAAELRFDVKSTDALSSYVRGRLRELCGNRINTDGVLIIHASSHRSQERNREDALRRLAAFIDEAATPVKHRRKTRPTRASKERRLEKKHQHSRTKKQRRGDWRSDG